MSILYVCTPSFAKIDIFVFCVKKHKEMSCENLILSTKIYIFCTRHKKMLVFHETILWAHIMSRCVRQFFCTEFLDNLNYV
jgi:hypothetical protein